jgi:hypothetical protein
MLGRVEGGLDLAAMPAMPAMATPGQRLRQAQVDSRDLCMDSVPTLLPQLVLVVMLARVLQSLKALLDQPDRLLAVPDGRGSDDQQAIEQPTRSAAQAASAVP